MKNRSDEEETMLPVNNVSWYDCQDFMKKINTKTTGGYRFPCRSRMGIRLEGRNNNRIFIWGLYYIQGCKLCRFKGTQAGNYRQL